MEAYGQSMENRLEMPVLLGKLSESMDFAARHVWLSQGTIEEEPRTWDELDLPILDGINLSIPVDEFFAQGKGQSSKGGKGKSKSKSWEELSSETWGAVEGIAMVWLG